MKKVKMAAFLMFIAVSLSAQVPQAFSYQAIARDESGMPLVSENVSVAVHILQGGNSVYEENHNIVTNDFGLFALEIGRQNSSIFQNIDWSAGNIELQVMVSGAINIETLSPILSAPYALLSERVVHEKQQLSINGNQLSISEGNSVVLPSASFLQEGAGIDITGNVISNTGDADADPTNEIQSLSINGSELQLSNGGGSVILPNATNYWLQTTGGIYYNSGKVGVGTLSLPYNLTIAGEVGLIDGAGTVKWDVVNNANGAIVSSMKNAQGQNRILQGISTSGLSYLSALSSQSGGAKIESTSQGDSYFTASNQQGIARAEIGTISNGEAFSVINDAQGNLKAGMGENAQGSAYILAKRGTVSSIGLWSYADGTRSFFLNDDQNTNRIQITLDVNNREFLQLKGPNGIERVVLSPSEFGATNGGAVSVLDSQGQLRGQLSSSPTHGEGHISMWNSDNTLGAEICTKSPISLPCVTLYHNNNWAARMYVDNMGKGKLYLTGDIEIDGDISAAGVKNFVVPHPNNPDKEIVYSALEGPEAAIYIRGTATLSDGSTVVTFPEEFLLVAAPQGMTIQLTPHSAESKGLAAIERHALGFKVKELFNGTGNYEFDWEVKAIRKGYEQFQVIRKK